MRFGRTEVVHATLLFSAAGVLVEAIRKHLFDGDPPPPGKHQREIPPPQGAAVVAVQFVHTVGESFANLQIFKLNYYAAAPAESFWEEYLVMPDTKIDLRGVLAGPDLLNRDQRHVLSTLLSGSDKRAWDLSSEFRRHIEGVR